MHRASTAVTQADCIRFDTSAVHRCSVRQSGQTHTALRRLLHLTQQLEVRMVEFPTWWLGIVVETFSLTRQQRIQ